MEQLKENAPKTISPIKELHQLYNPKSIKSTISYFDGKRGKTKWTSKVLLLGRYVLTLYVEIKHKRGIVTDSKNSKFPWCFYEGYSPQETSHNRMWNCEFQHV